MADDSEADRGEGPSSSRADSSVQPSDSDPGSSEQSEEADQGKPGETGTASSADSASKTSDKQSGHGVDESVGPQAEGPQQTGQDATGSRNGDADASDSSWAGPGAGDGQPGNRDAESPGAEGEASAPGASPEAQSAGQYRSGDTVGDPGRSDDAGEADPGEGADHSKYQIPLKQFVEETYGPAETGTEEESQEPSSTTDADNMSDPPSGDDLVKMEDEEASRAERARKAFWEDAGDAHDAVDKAGSALHDLWSGHKPEGHAVTSTAPEIAPAPHEGIDGGHAATGIMAAGIVVAEIGRWVRGKLR
jgi:hypothetical protein